MPQPALRHRPYAIALLLAGVAAVVVLSLFCGSSGIRPAAALRALAGGGDPLTRTVILDLRLPRLLAALGTGGLLALAGVLLQALFRNPLADPWVLGVAGGAAVGAVGAMALGAALLLVQGAAAAGALGAILLVYWLGRDGGEARLLLTGIAVASLCGALVTVTVSAADSERLRGILFWLAGDLGWAPHPAADLSFALLAVAAAMLLARPLNVLAGGELRARSVGLDVAGWRRALYLAAAVLTGVAVVGAGTIGFVGLLTPHAARLLLRTSDHRAIAPAAAVLGGTLLATADLLARTVVAPRQLPVGAVLAMAGAPVFILLLRASRGRGPAAH